MKKLQKAIKIMAGEIAAILEEQSPSICLFGSVALGDFREGWSDIDILCLTRGEIAEEKANRLVFLRQEMLGRFPGNPYYRSFEGGMLGLDGFLSGTPQRAVYWGTSGERITQDYRLDPFSRLELLDSGILLCGEDVRDRIARPEYGELRDAVERHYRAIRRHAQTTGKSIYSYGWLLDIARCVYTLRTGGVIAKTAAGEWALEEGICPVPSALSRAVEVRKNPADKKNDPETMEYAAALGPEIQRFADVLEAEMFSGNPDLG